MFLKIFQEKGQGVVEYALLLGLVAVLVVGVTTDENFWDKFQETFEKVVDQIINFNEVYDPPINTGHVDSWD